MDYSPGVAESDMTERLSLHFTSLIYLLSSVQLVQSLSRVQLFVTP